MKKILASVCLVLAGASCPAIGANVTNDKWTLIHIDLNGSKYFIVEASVRDRGELRKITFQIEHATPGRHTPAMGAADKPEALAKSIVYGAWLNCKRQQMQLFSYMAYDENNKLVDGRRDYTSKKMTDIDKNSLGYPVLAAGCALRI